MATLTPDAISCSKSGRSMTRVANMLGSELALFQIQVCCCDKNGYTDPECLGAVCSFTKLSASLTISAP